VPSLFSFASTGDNLEQHDCSGPPVASEGVSVPVLDLLLQMQSQVYYGRKLRKPDGELSEKESGSSSF
jgi:hypothetical protein